MWEGQKWPKINGVEETPKINKASEENPLANPIPCDEFSLHTNAFGVSLVFGVSHHGPPPGTPQRPVVPIPKARVLISWAMAKAMSEVMAKSVFAYEQSVGEIPLPKEIKDSLGLD